MGEFIVRKLHLNKAVKKLALHNIKMNDKIHANNLKVLIFLYWNDIKQQIKATMMSREKPQKKEKAM